ncbi:hypothetical protein PHYBOEH_007203 [Phytophthora boehmeriae]|uniref:Uncharacterized protein n=1 Tax=Phytophthora boehmeriae TaxID=109152 RepID=A0A8T1WB01_9STRA|nr:hypothetical protein PHYBOEH_007203 [Phytophthora boehmeriae]
MSDEEEESDDDFDFDYEQFLLAVQVQKYYYRGFYPRGIFVIWSLLRADCYDLSGCDDYGIPPIVYASKCGSVILLRLLLYYKADINALSKHARELKQSLDDNDDSPSSAWIRVGAGKWRPRDHLQQTELSSGETTATEVETFAADKQGVRELLTSDGKWQVFLGQQMQLSPAKSSVSQGHLTIEDFE